MNLIVSLIGNTVERNKINPVKEDYKELNRLVLHYESILCVFYTCFRNKYVNNNDGKYFQWITYYKANNNDKEEE